MRGATLLKISVHIAGSGDPAYRTPTEVSGRCRPRALTRRTAADNEAAIYDILERVFGQSPVIELKPESVECTISVYLASCPPRDQLRKLRNDLRSVGQTTPRVSIRQIRREDWAESWKRHFKPLEIGTSLLIKPSWSKRRPRAGQAVVVLDPGLSFGTGQHHTTRFCLEQLARSRLRYDKPSFLDVGTGSGILAIAAAKLGYRPVLAIDNDPEAARIAEQNARRNRVKIQIACRELSKVETTRRFNVVCANLTADVLVAAADQLVSQLSSDGSLVLSGILKRQFRTVLGPYSERGLGVVATRAEGEWKSAVLAR